MSEFELTPEDLIIKEVLKMYECNSCRKTFASWNGAPVCDSLGCSTAGFTERISFSTVPTTTGVQTDVTYDNLDTIDDFIQAEADIAEQDRDLIKLEKARMK